MGGKDLEEAIVGRVMGAFPAARRVVLFGSRAKGNASPESDYDVLVVTPTPLAPAARGAKLRTLLRGLGVAFDLVVVTPEEYERLRQWKSTVVSHAVREGRILHEAA